MCLIPQAKLNLMVSVDYALATMRQYYKKYDISILFEEILKKHSQIKGV